jgi:hypothetical protein
MPMPNWDPQKRLTKINGQTVDLGCAFNDHGLICQARGTISHSTSGTGPWFCSAHAWVILHDQQARQPGQEG